LLLLLLLRVVPAGISEGLLSGCCGILNESVRRQIYVVRTSGARLLALINDVMDAAALRQHRLVLKQERLELQQVVGDVSDLTRSLVDNDVSLRNEVPEGMLVWADSGRIIQVR
jgi:signal transduction histidine kinase